MAFVLTQGQGHEAMIALEALIDHGKVKHLGRAHPSIVAVTS